LLLCHGDQTNCVEITTLLASLGDLDGTLDPQTKVKLIRHVEKHFELTLEEQAMSKDRNFKRHFHFGAAAQAYRIESVPLAG
jgi:hypothetical protein